jgi:hypothetical protein
MDRRNQPDDVWTVNLCSKIYDLLVTRELELSSWAEVAMYNN